MESTDCSVDKFDFKKVIGKGNYAKVYLVEERATKKLYALKALKKKYVIEQKQQENILREKAILGNIHHPFLVRFYSCFQDQRKLYFLLQYCPGGQLFNLLRDNKLSKEDQARFYSAQVVIALEELHRNGVIYRDLKPENVLITADGYVKLTDFGLSKILDAPNATSLSICGTPEYLAPEMVRQEGHSLCLDWWTLGCLIYEMMNLFPPFRHDNRHKLFQIILTKQPELSKFPPKLQDLLSRLLEKNPRARLGAKGAKEIQEHPWFSSINWTSLRERKIKPFFIPKLSSREDTQYFDTEFTEEPVKSLSSSPIMDCLISDSSFEKFAFVLE